MTKLVAKSQLDMTSFIANANLANLFQFGSVLVQTSTKFQIKDVEQTQEVLTLTGSFSGYNAGGYPTTGMITGGSYTPGNTGFASISFSNASLSVEAFTGYVNSNDVAGAFQDLLRGNDQLIGSSLADVLHGFAGNDTMNGGGGADQLRGGLGNDSYIVDNRLDKAIELAGQGTDIVKSSVTFTLGNNVEKLTLTGTAAIDGTGNSAANVITGNGAANRLSGGGGNDDLKGLGGTDKLNGGIGNDKLAGGAGTDLFLFNSALNASTNVDRITDFSVADDSIQLDNDVFTAAGAVGALSAGAFHAGTSAQEADDRIIYDSATGKIFYDADGNGDGAAVLFAQVNAGVALTHADFLIVG